MTDHTIMIPRADPPDKTARRGKTRNLTDDQEVELLDAYTQTEVPVKELSERFGIRETFIYNVLNRAGVDWRRGNPESFMRWQANQAQPKHEETVPEPVEKALENMLKLPVLPPRPEPVAPTPTIGRRVRSAEVEPHQMWAVEVQGRLLIGADDIQEVIDRVRALMPDARIVSINPA